MKPGPVPSPRSVFPALLSASLCIGLFPIPALTARGAALREALTFHASFDRGVDADFALGDPKLYWGPAMVKREGIKPGLPADGSVTLEKGAGRFGDGLRFHKSSPGMVFFQAERNLAYSASGWSGTVSFWLSLTPDVDLAPGYTDPIQITPKAWNNAAFFVEFTKDDVPRELRLGVYADFPVWNPGNRNWDKIPLSEKPLVRVVKPPFQRDRWTHVVFTFDRFNTGRPDGVARLYLDGARQGEMAPRTQTFTWDISQSMIMLGLSYIGRWDELALFNRALSDSEVRSLHRLRRGVAELHR